MFSYAPGLNVFGIPAKNRLLARAAKLALPVRMRENNGVGDVVESADTAPLKGAGPQGPYRFKSDHPHQNADDGSWPHLDPSCPKVDRVSLMAFRAPMPGWRPG